MILTESISIATSLADRGDFRAAVASLGDRWPGIGVEPARNGETDLEFAELLLICGALTVEIGRFRLAPVQAEGKDLLSKAVRMFGDCPRRYMAMFWLASAYLWCGENNETLSLVDSILDGQEAESEIVFRASLLKQLAHLNLGNFAAAEAALSSVELFIETVSPMVRGKFFLNRGMLYRRTGRLENALTDYERAITELSHCDGARFQAAAQNNMAGVYTEQGKYCEARSAAESALSLFRELNDRAHEAKVWDQIARIHEREENFLEMVRCADRAVEILSAGDHDGWLAEALITQGTARARLGMAEAQTALARALEICDRQGDQQQAEAATKAVWEIVRRGKENLEAWLDAVSPYERNIYERLLEKHHGRVSPSAHELGLHHQEFQRRLKQSFPDLLTKRIPPRRRHRSIIKLR